MRCLLKAITMSLATIALGSSTGLSHAQPSEAIVLKSGFSDTRKLNRPAHTVVIGNPDIADANVAPGNIILVTGKRLGTTNVIALDDTGAEIYRAAVLVGDPKYRVAVRFPVRAPGAAVLQIYWCEEYCDIRPMRAQALPESAGYQVAPEGNSTTTANPNPAANSSTPADTE